MVFRTLCVCFFFLSSFAFAQNRKPAVEDFVEIEIEKSNLPTAVSGAFFNLEHNVGKVQFYKSPKKKPSSEITTKKSLGTGAFFGIAMILGLPVIVWLALMSHLKNKAQLESASNIETLENYRQKRAKKNEEEYKKAS